jgi:putative transposase
MDWGVVNFATLSNGEVIDQCQPLKKFLPKLAKWQRRMARKKKFSKNWRKAKARITKLHTKVANIRRDFLHKVSNDISKNHVVVCIEDLQVGNMRQRATKVWAEPLNLGRQPVRVAPPTGIQDAVARRSACPCAAEKHQPQVSSVWARIS